MRKLLENAKKSKVQLLVEGNKIKAMKGKKLLEMYELEQGDDLIEVMDEIMEDMDPYLEEEILYSEFDDVYVPEPAYEEVMDEFALEEYDDYMLEGKEEKEEESKDESKDEEDEKDEEDDEEGEDK